ncbi:MAG: enoyl-CoA hydratase/isomerase family protein [Pyrinomonadaceae bacterium]|nr:enoyl-CoA hydratase/isomerase family protein [Pyrinomonadaceae bacterium]
MNLETVIYELNENIATIKLNRPESLNAFSVQLTKDLASAIDQAVADKARAIVLTGAGRAFSAGGDLMGMVEMQKKGVTVIEPMRLMHGAILKIRETEIPFVAAVNGVCAGAGTNFALACDVVFADENAIFNEAFIKIGLSPDCGGSFFLPRVVGEKIAAELMMTGDSIDAKRAVEIGMINRVVSAESLLAEATAFAKKLSLQPTAVIGRIKRMMNATFSNNLHAQLDLEEACQIESGSSPNFREGVQSFFEKRKPNFTGD